MILSHAHIDHCGNLPQLVKLGFAGPIYATHATAHLADLMVRNAGHIQEANAEDAGEERNGNGKEGRIRGYF